MPKEHFFKQESFAVIHSMINKARNQFTENGHLYLLWGWVVFVCSIGHFSMQYIWPVMYGMPAFLSGAIIRYRGLLMAVGDHLFFYTGSLPYVVVTGSGSLRLDNAGI